MCKIIQIRKQIKTPQSRQFPLQSRTLKYFRIISSTFLLLTIRVASQWQRKEFAANTLIRLK
jgi:hypothetical protein